MDPLKSPVDPSESRQAQRVADMPERLRPREAVERHGVGSVSDDVLIAILLRSGVKGLNVSDLARSLLNRYETLSQLASATVDELAGLPGMGPVFAAGPPREGDPPYRTEPRRACLSLDLGPLRRRAGSGSGRVHQGRP